MATPYTTDGIQVLTLVEAIRKRPGMYCGGVDSFGLHNLIWNLVEPAVLRARAGQHLETLDVEAGDDWLTVRHDGPDLPVETVDGTPALAALFTQFPRRGMFVTPGCEPVITCALSESFEVETHRDGEWWTQTYHRGATASEVTSTGRSSARGTKIRFRPDPTIFPSTTFDSRVVAERLRTLAWLTPELAIRWQGVPFPSRGGLAGWAAELCAGECEIDLALRHDANPAANVDSSDAVAVEIALAWRGAGAPIVRGFVDITVTPRGQHVDAMWSGLAALASRITDTPISATRARAQLGPGIVALVRVTVPEPQFAGQTKEKLDCEIAGTAVERAFAAATISPELRRFLLARVL